MYGIKFNKGKGSDEASLDLTAPSNYEGGNLWSYIPATPSSPYSTQDFGHLVRLPNQKMPVDKTMGSIAVKLTPVSGTSQQAVLRLYGTDNDDIGIYYNSSGAFQYEMRKDGIPFANMTIAPPTGKSFANKEVILTFEAVKNTDRKYAKSQKKNLLSLGFRVRSLTMKRSFSRTFYGIGSMRQKL